MGSAIIVVMDPVLLTSVLSLAGVLLGASGALAGNYVVTRTARNDAKAAREATRRNERRDAILEFLDNAQHIEQMIEDRWHKVAPMDGAEAARRAHRAWYLQKKLLLVCSSSFENPALDFTNKLIHALWNGPPDGTPPWEHLSDRRNRFLEGARQELGISNR